MILKCALLAFLTVICYHKELKHGHTCWNYGLKFPACMKSLTSKPSEVFLVLRGSEKGIFLPLDVIVDAHSYIRFLKVSTLSSLHDRELQLGSFLSCIISISLHKRNIWNLFPMLGAGCIAYLGSLAVASWREGLSVDAEHAIRLNDKCRWPQARNNDFLGIEASRRLRVLLLGGCNEHAAQVVLIVKLLWWDTAAVFEVLIVFMGIR